MDFHPSIFDLVFVVVTALDVVMAVMLLDWML
jgi:hypothetical protein